MSEEVVGAQTKLCVVNLSPPAPCPPDARPRRGRSGEWGKLRPVSEGSARCHQTTLRVVEGSAGALASCVPMVFQSPRSPGRMVGFHMWDKGRGAWPSPIWIPVLPWALTSTCGGD